MGEGGGHVGAPRGDSGEHGGACRHLSGVRPADGVVGGVRSPGIERGIRGRRSAPALAHVSDTSEGAERAGRVGRVTAGATLGFLAGPALSGWLAGVDPVLSSVSRPAQIVAVPFLVIAVLGFAVFAACLLLLPESLGARGPTGRESASRTDMAGTPAGPSFAQFARLLALTALGTFALGAFEVGSALRGQQVLGFGPRMRLGSTTSPMRTCDAEGDADAVESVRVL